MYVVRRVWETKPGEARMVASLVQAMGDEYEAAGKRTPSRVYFNSGTVPGEKDRVHMEWVEAVIDSPYRSDVVPSPERAQHLYARVRDLTTATWIEFFELMTPDKLISVDS